MAFTVDFQEEHEFPKSLWQNGVFVGTRQLICAWSDRITLLTELDIWPNNQWPYGDGSSDALTDRVATVGIGAQTNAPGTGAEYAEARLTVRYTNAGPQGFDNGATLISERIETTTETRELDEGLFRWDNNAGTELRDGEAPLLIQDEMTYVVQYHRATVIPGWVLTRVGTVNSNVVDTWLLGLSFSPERLKYKGASVLTSHSLGRILTYEVVTRYRFRPAGWNKFWREATAQYEPLYLSGGAEYKPYPPVPYF
jgi:hypothetical protein